MSWRSFGMDGMRTSRFDYNFRHIYRFQGGWENGQRKRQQGSCPFTAKECIRVFRQEKSGWPAPTAPIEERKEMPMTRTQVLQIFDRIRVWQQGDKRAPHKPLLILLALGRLQREEAPVVEFSQLVAGCGTTNALCWHSTATRSSSHKAANTYRRGIFWRGMRWKCSNERNTSFEIG